MYFNELKVGMAIDLATASIDKGRVECGMRNAEYGARNDLIPLTLHSQGNLIECRMQNAECRTTSLHYVPFTRKE